MSVTAILFSTLIEPLLVIYHKVYTSLFELSSSHGVTILLFGLFLNLVLTPIYFQMERASREGRRIRAPMLEEIERIKSTFKGRERYFYVRTIHRHFGFSPFSVLASSGDLFLQITVFATVYIFLSGLPVLAGVGFMGIPDLSRPDGILWGVNLLPLLMTAANVGSAIAYTREARKKRNALVLAGLFLILLYQSASGLVLYWTLNNVFSLVRNLVERAVAVSLVDHRPSWLTRFASQR